MNHENAIEVKDVKKKFKIYRDKGNMLKEKAIHWSRNKYDDRWVLNGISFEVKKGEAVGLIGSNGCGKSTTLKLLTRIMYPDFGSIEIDGRVSSLLELGAGFHPDLSGRENIYINASVFGLTKHEIDKKVADIIEFSELEEYIDNPVRTYSSGMYMRLAFSVAINVEAEILLIDEILAVGDISFQAKCLNRLREIKEHGATIVIVSHSTAQIEQICDKSIWLLDGKIKREGSSVEVHREYANYMCVPQDSVIPKTEILAKSDLPDIQEIEKPPQPKDEPPIKLSTSAEIESVVVTGDSEEEKNLFELGETLNLKINIIALETISDYVVEINVVRADGLFCYGCSTDADNFSCKEWNGRKEIGVRFPKMNLLTGQYHFDMHIMSKNGSSIFFEGNIAEFEIVVNSLERGLIYLEHEWLKG